MLLLSQKVLNWLKENKSCDYRALMLKAGSDEERRTAVIRHEARRRALAKLPVFAANPDFIFPSVLSVEQSTNQAVALFHASLIKHTDSVVDLTCGLGIDAMTIASIARSVTAIDMNPLLADALKHNSEAMGIDNLTVIEADSMEWLAESTENFDVAFIDPFRRDNCGNKVVRFSDCTPDVVSNLPMILSHCSRLIVKASPMHDISLAIEELKGHVMAVKIVGNSKECHEILLMLSKDKSSAVEIESVTILPDGNMQRISWIYGEHYPGGEFVLPVPEDNVYELWPAAMKSGAYNMIAERTGTHLISASTHVYSSTSDVDGFPGNRMKVLDVVPFSKASVKNIKSRFTHLNVATRNFPLTAPELEKRLGVKSGGELRLLGVTDSRRKPYLILLEPVR